MDTHFVCCLKAVELTATDDFFCFQCGFYNRLSRNDSSLYGGDKRNEEMTRNENDHTIRAYTKYAYLVFPKHNECFYFSIYTLLDFKISLREEGKKRVAYKSC